MLKQLRIPCSGCPRLWIMRRWTPQPTETQSPLVSIQAADAADRNDVGGGRPAGSSGRGMRLGREHNALIFSSRSAFQWWAANKLIRFQCFSLTPSHTGISTLIQMPMIQRLTPSQKEILRLVRSFKGLYGPLAIEAAMNALLQCPEKGVAGREPRRSVDKTGMIRRDETTDVPRFFLTKDGESRRLVISHHIAFHPLPQSQLARTVIGSML